MKILLAACVLAMALPAYAEDKMPVPKVYQGMGTQKGQWKVDILEGGSRRDGKAPPSMTICSDNLANQAHKGSSSASKVRPECKYKVLKDTPSEAIIESTCNERTTVVKTTRENDKTLLMEMDSKSGGNTHMKMRYSYLGACREGQGAVSLDKNSEQCVKLRERAAKMDPEKQCAKSSQREQCLERMQAAQKQLAAMCN